MLLFRLLFIQGLPYMEHDLHLRLPGLLPQCNILRAGGYQRVLQCRPVDSDLEGELAKIVRAKLAYYPMEGVNWVLQTIGVAFEVHDTQLRSRGLAPFASNSAAFSCMNTYMDVSPSFMDIVHYCLCYIGLMTGKEKQMETIIHPFIGTLCFSSQVHISSSKHTMT